VRTRVAVVRDLGASVRWGWVACDERQREVGHTFWYNAYWKMELAR
jgi:hypothetical protein